MKKTRLHGLGVVAICALLLCVGCLGPSNATRRVYQYNMSFESDWAKEGMFLLMFPWYMIVSNGDKLIFNSWYWWTGEHLIDPPEAPGPEEFGL